MRLALVLLPIALAACEPRTLAGSRAGDDTGDALARAALRAHGCIHCHTIDGLPGATGKAGPPLTGLRERAVIAGQHPNTLENVTRLIMDPRGMSPGSAMPATVTDESQAREIAAFLYRQK
jgi:cytochrome c